MDFSHVIKFDKEELPQIKSLEARLTEDESNRQLLRLVGPNGDDLSLPPSVYETLRRVVHLMAQGRPISIVLFEHELTTQEAAEILNVSRPFLVKLLEKDEIPFHQVGSHRRIRFADLMAYKSRRDVRRKEVLKRITQIGEEIEINGEDEE